MFSVPGWSVLAKNLKTETEISGLSVKQKDLSSGRTTGEGKSKKRKRGQTFDQVTQAGNENLEKLWNKYLQPKAAPERAEEEQEEPPKLEQKLKRKKKKARKIPECTSEQDSPAVAPRGAATGPQKSQSEKQNGLAKYERRKAKAEQKRQGKKLPQGTNANLEPLGDRTVTTKVASPARSPSPSVPILDVHKKAAESIETSEILHPSTREISSSRPNGKGDVGPDQASATTNLTPLQQRMAQKLVSARFRHLNETLYTSSSSNASSLFSSSPQAYTAYHAGFRAQTSVWPSNPVSEFVQEIRKRGMIRKSGNDRARFGPNKFQNPKKKFVPGRSNEGSDPLPRDFRSHTCRIVDLGCGDAVLAAALSSQQDAHLKLSIRSFDLSRGDTPNAKFVTVADITDLRSVGVPDSSVDLAICCLSLMNTNWVHIVVECARIVREGGEIWVAEIRSRFVKSQDTRKGGGDGRKTVEKPPVGRNEGFKIVQRQNNGANDDEYTSDLEAPSQPPKSHTNKTSHKDTTNNNEQTDVTDVSAFTDVFRRRGFSLKGTPEQTNKMFVKMFFVKDGSENRGRNGKGPKIASGVRAEPEREEDHSRTKPKLKFIDGDSDDEDILRAREVEEGRNVLKPCVYKTR